MMSALNNLNPNPPTTHTSSLALDLPTFQNIVTENSLIINKAFQNQLIIPKFCDFCDDISNIYEKVIFQLCYTSTYNEKAINKRNKNMRTQND